MNFDFIKNLDGLNLAYKPCTNAEELVVSKPDLSMIASRKSAEMLAKFIYLNAYAEEASYLTFSDILNDATVKKYLGNKAIIDAFHFIRKKGNEAVHTLDTESSDTALSVLSRLHFVFGETAKKLELIKFYPEFKEEIEENNKANLLEVDEPGKMAKEMYDQYIVSKYKLNRLKNDFQELMSSVHFIPGGVDLNEYIRFDDKPKHTDTIVKIQEHFGFVGMEALKAIREGIDHEEYDMPDVIYRCRLTIKGEKGYSTTSLTEFIYGIMYDLPDAEGFEIESYYYGPSLAPWFNNDAPEEFNEIILHDIADTEEYTYVIFEWLYNHGAGQCNKIVNGKYVASEEYKDIIEKEFENDWWCWNICLNIEFDYEKYPDILEALRNAVRKHIPEDQVEYCENDWEESPEILLSSIQWPMKDLVKIRDFAKEINEIIEPIRKECDVIIDGDWYQTVKPFGVAGFDWDNREFGFSGFQYLD